MVKSFFFVFFFLQRPRLADLVTRMDRAIKANYCRSFGLCRGHHEQAIYVTLFQILYLQKNVLGIAGNRTHEHRVGSPDMLATHHGGRHRCFSMCHYTLN